jgi:hypothetical protein
MIEPDEEEHDHNLKCLALLERCTFVRRAIGKS